MAQKSMQLLQQHLAADKNLAFQFGRAKSIFNLAEQNPFSISQSKIHFCREALCSAPAVALADDAARTTQKSGARGSHGARLGCIFLFHVPSRGGAKRRGKIQCSGNSSFPFPFLFFCVPFGCAKRNAEFDESRRKRKS